MATEGQPEPSTETPQKAKPWLFTSESARLLQEKSVAKRLETQTPERRRYLARRAVLRRWYRPSADDVERIECLLTFLANEVVDALMKDNHELAVRTAIGMQGYERMKIALRAGAMKNVTPEIDQEIQKKLTDARERRERALTAEDRQAAEQAK